MRSVLCFPVYMPIIQMALATALLLMIHLLQQSQLDQLIEMGFAGCQWIVIYYNS